MVKLERQVKIKPRCDKETQIYDENTNQCIDNFYQRGYKSARGDFGEELKFDIINYYGWGGFGRDDGLYMSCDSYAEHIWFYTKTEQKNLTDYVKSHSNLPMESYGKYHNEWINGYVKFSDEVIELDRKIRYELKRFSRNTDKLNNKSNNSHNQVKKSLVDVIINVK